MNFHIGQKVFINLGGAVCNTCVVVSSLTGTVQQVTEKAISLKANGNGVLWIPKSALDLIHLADKYNNMSVRFKKWFKFDAYGRRFIDLNSDHNGVSA